MRVTDAEKANPYAEDFLDQDHKKLTADLVEPLKALFCEFAAKTQESGLHYEDMRQLLAVIGLVYSPKELKAMFDKVNTDGDDNLNQKEFLNFFYGMVTNKDADLPIPTKDDKKEPEASPAGDDDEDEDEMPDEFKDLDPAEQQKQIKLASFKAMIIGTSLVLVFTDPMVDVLSQIGVNTGIPAFYVSFVLAPFASNASELAASMKLASKKTMGSITQSLQTLEGAACMNNTYCLGIFYALIYYQGLAWKFTAETLCIVLVQVLMFLLVMRNSKQTMMTGVLICCLYPVSLIFVAGLEKMGLD